jgi:hypothetical protein
MKKLLVLFLVFLPCYSFADIPTGSFSIIEKKSNTAIKLGDSLSVFLSVFGKTTPVEKKYSNISLLEYRYKDLIFATSAVPEVDENKKLILSIEFRSALVQLVDGFQVGTAKKDVLEKYGPPEEIVENAYYFYNHEWDLMEMKITFDKRDKIESIRISTGA